MLGYLLARAGVAVEVLEKHSDFFRDFRGDTVHPSTLEIMYELEILNDLLKIPHQEVRELGVQIGDQQAVIADFATAKTKCKYIAMMPQWDFLNFLAGKAKHYSPFSLRMNTEVIDLIEENGSIIGVIANTPEGKLRVKAKLVVGADGRTSIVRKQAELTVEDYGAPMDVFWLRLSRKDTDPSRTGGRVIPGLLFAMINRHEYWQCAFVIPKGKADEIRQAGIEKFRARIVEVAPFMSDRIHEIKSWDDVKLLTVKVDRLTKWYRDGLLCIGDAAHAMSPVGGVGINLAVQDAVAAANFLYKPLSEGECTEEDLLKVQKWRMYPTRMTQRLQLFMQRNFVARTLGSKGPMVIPSPVRFLTSIPAIRSFVGKVLGVGFRPEHIRTPEKK
jgi:2-polyprenyl-6-methoxyphenol hydroxylase-like FAD-dependent oxidoreductase